MSALDDLKVVDFSESIAGQYCSRLFAGYGADVVLVEPPGGSTIRKVGPYSKPFGDSTTFYHLNLDKRSVTLDLATSGGNDALVTLCSKANVVIMSATNNVARLRQAAPDAVFCRISDFGITGPYAGWRGNEMIHQALSGVMYYNGRAGHEPLYGVGQRVQHVAGVAAYTAILAALHRKGGELIDIDLHKTAASMTYNLPNQFFYSGTFDERDGTKYNPDLLIKCQGGWVIVFVYAYRWEAFCDALGLKELKADPEFRSQADRLARWDKVSAAASGAASQVAAADLVQLLQQAGVPAAASHAPADLANSPHLAARDYWQTVETAKGNRRAFGAPFRLTNSQWRASKPLAEEGRQ